METNQLSSASAPAAEAAADGGIAPYAEASPLRTLGLRTPWPPLGFTAAVDDDDDDDNDDDDDVCA